MREFSTCVLLVNYNSVNDTLDCIKSIQASGGDIFIVVVENGSKDIDIIAGKLGGISNVELIISKDNLGFGRANNLGIKWIKEHISCKYIFLLNNDTVIEPDTIANLQAYMDAAPDSVTMAAPKIYVYSNSQEIWYGGGTFNYTKITPEVNKDPDTKTTTTLFASGCAMFFRAGYLYANGGFDPFFFMYDEDVELSMRLGAQGKQIVYFPEAVVYHKCQGSQTKVANLPTNQLDPRHPSLLFYLHNTILNRRYIINKYLKGIAKLKTQIKHSFYWLMKSAQYFLAGKFKAAGAVLKYLFLISPPSIMK